MVRRNRGLQCLGSRTSARGRQRQTCAPEPAPPEPTVVPPGPPPVVNVDDEPPSVFVIRPDGAPSGAPATPPPACAECPYPQCPDRSGQSRCRSCSQAPVQSRPKDSGRSCRPSPRSVRRTEFAKLALAIVVGLNMLNGFPRSRASRPGKIPRRCCADPAAGSTPAPAPRAVRTPVSQGFCRRRLHRLLANPEGTPAVNVSMTAAIARSCMPACPPALPRGLLLLLKHTYTERMHGSSPRIAEACGVPFFKTLEDPLRTQFNDLPDRFSQSGPPLAASPTDGLISLYARGL